MIFAAPWLLLGLLALPALWWLLRVTPPAPRRQDFPSVRLLLELPAEQTPARTPPWLLLLRLAAAALLVFGLAGPILGKRAVPAGIGTLTIVLDDGFASAADWPLRLAAADRLVAEAQRMERPALLLTTASAADGAGPRVFGPMTAAELRAVLPTLRPFPWTPDRAAAGQLLSGLATRPGSIAYISDGLRHGTGWTAFADALGAAKSLRVVSASPGSAAVLSASAAPEGWLVRVARAGGPTPTSFGVRAEAADGRVLARGLVNVPGGANSGVATLTLPTELRNRVDRLRLDAAEGGAIASAAGTFLLDEVERRRPVGLLLAEGANADAPLTGSAFFLRRALSPYAEWREGGLNMLLSRPLSILLAADHSIAPGTEAETLRGWVERGGTLIRFAGPEIAQAAVDGQPDPLLPVTLLPSERQIGGSMSWGKPATLAPFPPASPFAGLTESGRPTAPDGGGGDVAVSRQVLSDPSADLGGATWARLTDGTPLVTQRPFGAGRVVLFHVTANADWSSLPLSGLFVDMLRRLLALSAGVNTEATAGGDLTPIRLLDGFGEWTQPTPAARPIAASAWATTVASPAHPPGLYGPDGGRRVLNLSQGLGDPVAAPAIEGARVEALREAAPPRPLGPLLVALAALLLVVDLLGSLRLRGLLGTAATTASLALLLSCGIFSTARADEPYDAALATRLAYVRTSDEAVDSVARAGLAGLSNYVNDRTASHLAAPASVEPGRDDLSFYPLIYWPISADALAPTQTMIVALNAYMAGGGVLLIDTRDGGSGAGMGSGGRDVLRRLSTDANAGAVALAAPPLAALTSTHVLARSFYLLSDFPGRYEGDTVWIARDIDRSNDSVSPLIIGAHDWAAAWAVNADGQHPFATLPGGERQRVFAYRFGVNLVMYSLTGNYKGDQVHVPALLQRLGQ